MRDSLLQQREYRPEEHEDAEDDEWSRHSAYCLTQKDSSAWGKECFETVRSGRTIILYELMVREDTMNPKWLEWTQKLQAVAQSGLAYSKNPFDKQHYETIREIAAEIAASYSNTELGHVMDIFAGETGYATPKIDVRGAVFRGEELLLVKEQQDGLWTLPGGWADVNEPPSESVSREVREESGYQTRVVRLLALYDRNKHGHPPFPFHVYKLFFQCEIMGGDPKASLETEDVAFFHREKLPELSLTRVTPSEISRIFELYDHPEWPTEFD